MSLSSKMLKQRSDFSKNITIVQNGILKLIFVDDVLKGKYDATIS